MVVYGALPGWLTLRPDGVRVAVKAVPHAPRTRAVGVQDGALRVQIAAPPDRGAANAALCAYLAGAAGVGASAARLRHGRAGARKLVEIDGEPGVLAGRLVDALGAAAGGPTG
jgi:uncharacterized protein YggU (UPF0235/DUF167 family)